VQKCSKENKNHFHTFARFLFLFFYLFLLNPTHKMSLIVSVAESCTGGLLQSHITRNPGVSKWFAGGLTAYSIEHKVNLLGVSREEASACDCVSETIALQMARGVCKLFGSDIGLATTGFCSGDVRYCWGAVFVDEKSVVQKFEPRFSAMTRQQFQEQITTQMMEMFGNFMREEERSETFNKCDNAHLKEILARYSW
jgi:PncC family amidohydrolase